MFFNRSRIRTPWYEMMKVMDRRLTIKNDAGGFVAALLENQSFRESVSGLSSPVELHDFLARSGFHFNEYQLIQATAKFIEEGMERGKELNGSIPDPDLLELLDLL